MIRKAMVLFLTVMLVAALGLVLPVAADAAKHEAKASAAPKITLDRVEIAHYWGYYLDAKERSSSVMDLAFVFNIENPTASVVKLEDMKFTVNFEPGFDIVTVTTYEDISIPAKTTNQLRVHATFDVFTTRLNLLVTGGYKLQELNIKADDQLKKWWDDVKDFKFKIKVTEGTASFMAGKNQIITSFEGEFPK